MSVAARRPGVSNEDDYLDPELDPTPGDDSLPGPFSLPQLVVGIHVASAAALAPFAWLAYRNGNVPGAASLGLLSVLVVAVGVAAGRVAARRD